MESFGGIGGGYEEEQLPDWLASMMIQGRGIEAFLKDNSIAEMFEKKPKKPDYLDIKDVKLANLTPEQEYKISILYSLLGQIETLERKYHEKGVLLDLSTVKRAIAADIKAIAATSRGRKGFERKMWQTHITREETSQQKKTPLFSGLWRRNEE